MIATSASTAGGTGPNFDLPTIASALPYVSSQTAVSFSQLLLNTPQPAPQPAPPEPKPQPPVNHKATQASDQGSGVGQSTDADSQAPSQAQATSQTSQQETTPQSSANSSPPNPSSTNPASPTQSSSAATGQAAHGHVPGKPSPGEVAHSAKDENSASSANASSNVSAVALAVVSASGKPSDAVKSAPADGGKPAAHGAAQSADTAQAAQPTDAAQTDATVQTTAETALTLPVSTTDTVETTIDDKTDGKAKPAVSGKVATDAAALASSRLTTSSPSATAYTILQPAATAAQATTGTPAAPKGKSIDAAEQADVKAPDTVALLSAGSNTDKLADNASSTPASDESVAVATTDVVSQVVATITSSLPQHTSTTSDRPTTANETDAVPPTAAPGTPSAGSSAPPNSASTAPATSTPQNASSSPSAGLGAADRTRFVQRVARAFQTVGDTGGQIRLRLSPPELGSLQLQITVKQGALTAQIQADNSTAQQVLLDSLPDLRERLAQQDIRIERFDVDVSGQSSGGLPQSSQGNPEFGQAGRQSAATRNVVPPTADAATSGLPRPGPVFANGALNVIV